MDQQYQDNASSQQNNSQLNPQKSRQQNASLICENQHINTFSFRPPTKLPNQVFVINQNNEKFSNNQSQQKQQIQLLKQQQSLLIDNQDNKSQTSQKSNSSVNSRLRKGSFLDKLSQRQQQQQNRLKQQKLIDSRSIFLQNVDYKSTKQQLQLLFEDCGKIQRVTILKDQFTGRMKGCAYVSFGEEEAVEKAIKLTGVGLRGRIIKVHRKRTNLPGVQSKKKDEDIKKNFLGIMQSYTMVVMRGRGRGRGR